MQNDNNCLHFSSKDLDGNIREISITSEHVTLINKHNTLVQEDLKTNVLQADKIKFLAASRKLMNFCLCNDFEFNNTGSCNADNYILVNRRNNTTVATAESDVKNRKLYRSTACRQIISPHLLFSVCVDCTSLKRKKTYQEISN